MIKYFKKLLNTLISIDKHLNEIRKSSDLAEHYLQKISRCVRENHHSHGDSASLSTKHWND
jgi:hypothetical protein